MSKQIERYSLREVENRIFTLRDTQVMIDHDIAEMYGLKTKVLNQAVKRNIERFPEKFRFQLSNKERDELVTICDRLANLKHSSSMPNAFTEQGVAMLSSVLKSPTAIQVSLQIIDAFVEMRKVIQSQAGLLQRMDLIHLKLANHDQKFNEIFKALETKNQLPPQGIFFDGQIYDAYAFVSDLIRSAEESIQIIDNYVDDTVLTLLSKRSKGVKVTIYTKTISKQLKLDIEKHNLQYPVAKVVVFKEAHDRFMIIDGKQVLHIGASIKDLGKKWFAFTELQADAVSIIDKINSI